MSSDLSVTRVAAVSAGVEAARPAGAALDDKKGLDDRQGRAAVPVGKSLPNPTLRLDPGLAIVVIEFRDDSGAVRSTIPTEQQLEAYRSWDRGHIGEPPKGGRESGGRESGGAATPGAAAPGTAVTITGYTSTSAAGVGAGPSASASASAAAASEAGGLAPKAVGGGDG